MVEFRVYCMLNCFILVPRNGCISEYDYGFWITVVFEHNSITTVQTPHLAKIPEPWGSFLKEAILGSYFYFRRIFKTIKGSIFNSGLLKGSRYQINVY